MGFLKDIFNGGWEECHPPGWVWGAYKKRVGGTHGLYGNDMMLRGKHFEYKITNNGNWGQGFSRDRFYRRKL